ncbi:hypothetical protein GH733_014782 [Mirounga leonina]|nr:hypothetical protein GH733_014782 [Mirounga leonina]
MVAPLGGMFSEQLPGHPGDSRSQTLLLQVMPGPPRTSTSTLVDELESSFEACFASLVSQDYGNGTDQQEIRTGKDVLGRKHLTKLRHWQQVLEDINVQHKKPAIIPQGSLVYLQQASANIPAPSKT